MKNIGAITSILYLLYSCSSYDPMSFQDKVSYYKTKNNEIAHPFNLPIKRFKYQARANRSISSYNHKRSTEDIKILYFKTLFTQYTRLKRISSIKGVELNSCPAYHNQYLNQKEQRKQQNLNSSIYKKVSNINWEELNKSTINNYKTRHNIYLPLLYLPVSYQKDSPRIIDYLKNNKAIDLKFSTQIHLNDIYKELNQLCQTGNSQYTYLIQNMYTLRDNIKPSSKQIKILLNIPIFSNEIMYQSLNWFVSKSSKNNLPISRSISSITNNTSINASNNKDKDNDKDNDINKIYQQIKISWLKQYIQQNNH